MEVTRKGLKSGLSHGWVSSVIWEENMAAGADLSRPFIILEDSYENVSTAEDERLDNLKQLTSGKPPRHLSAVHHCVISSRLLSATDLVS